MKTIKIYQNQIIITISIIIALLLRFNLFYIQTPDFTGFLNIWYNFILENGRFWALKEGSSA